MRNRRGFTLLELLVVTLVLGLLAALGMLKYMDLRNAAVAAQLSQEIRSIQVASLNYFADQEQWPPEAGAGSVPTGLGPLLPGQLSTSFDRGQYVLDYEHMSDSSGTIIGVAVTSSDPKLFAKFVQYLGNKGPYFVSGSTLTYLIAGPGGIF